MLKTLLAIGAAILLSFCTAGLSFAAELKPRIIVLTDISPITVEPDDFESTIRLLVHADLFEIEGLVATTGWSNAGGSERPDIIRTIIDAYEKDSPNLLKRSGQGGFLKDEDHQEVGYWPSPAYLRDHTVLGSRKMGMQFIGADNNSPGSDLIIRIADEKDDRPVYVLAWGGANTLAQAIWKVQTERTPDQLKAFLHKIRVYTITDQDRPQRGNDPKFSSHYWMRKEFSKDLLFLWDESAWTFQNGTGKANWNKYAADIQGKGNLGAIYPKYKYGVEGDTPSFLYVLPNGLNDPEKPAFGGWGGMFVWGTGPDRTTECFVNQVGTSINAAARKYEQRFYPAIYNNFVARMDWARNGKGNRNPDVIVNGDKTLGSIKLTPTTGSEVTLDASTTTDPDGDRLAFSWWIMAEAGVYNKDVSIAGNNTSRVTVMIPEDAAGKSLHVICEVTDDGTPRLTSYRRIVIEPAAASGKPAGAAQPVRVFRPRVVVSTDFPPVDARPDAGPADHRSDPDDLQSMVRFLLYANEFDVEGLIASSGTFANIARKRNILDVLDRYEKIYDNLRKHDSRYPTAEALRAVTYQGLSGTWGKSVSNNLGVGKDSEASEAIIRIVDKPDPRPVWFCVWGDCSNITQAIWKVRQTRTAADLKAFLGKTRIHQIAHQDDTIDWLLKEFPDLFIIYSRTTYQGMFGGSDPLSNVSWVNENIRQNHGPLGAIYPPAGIGSQGVCEGDSPSFLHLVSAVRGINDPEDPTQPSWGGQFKRDGTSNHYLDGPGRQTISKWRAEYQAEFKERAGWMVD